MSGSSRISKFHFDGFKSFEKIQLIYIFMNFKVLFTFLNDMNLYTVIL
jgi:hypothetical protein